MSCVPMATRLRCLHRFWCSLSCRSMNELYRPESKRTPRSTAHTTNGRTSDVSGFTTMRCIALPAHAAGGAGRGGAAQQEWVPKAGGTLGTSGAAPRGREARGAATASRQRTGHVCEAVLRRRHAAEEDVERARNALQAEHVVSVGGDVDLVDDLVAGVAYLLPQLLAEHLLFGRLRGWAAVPPGIILLLHAHQAALARGESSAPRHRARCRTRSRERQTPPRLRAQTKGP